MTHPTHFFLIHVNFGREGWGTLTDGPDVQTLSDAAYAVLDWFDARSPITVFPSMDTLKVLEIYGSVCLDRTADALAECVSRFADDDPRDVPQEWRDLVGVAA